NICIAARSALGPQIDLFAAQPAFLLASSAFTERGGVSHSRQEDAEQAPAPLIACKLDSPAVCLDRPARDCKTQSDAAFFPGAAGVHPIEAIEDTVPVCCGNPRAGVSYLDHCLLDTRFQFDADGSAIRRVFYRVVDHVREGMAHERGVSHGAHGSR